MPCAHYAHMLDYGWARVPGTLFSAFHFWYNYLTILVLCNIKHALSLKDDRSHKLTINQNHEFKDLETQGLASSDVILLYM